MSEKQQLDDARRVLAWVYDRSRRGLNSFKRSERDRALSDLNHATQPWHEYLNPEPMPRQKDHDWFGEQP